MPMPVQEGASSLSGPCGDRRIQHPTRHGANSESASHDTEAHSQAEVEVLTRKKQKKERHSSTAMLRITLH